MTADRANSDPSSWDPALDAVTAAPKQHKVLFENDASREWAIFECFHGYPDGLSRLSSSIITLRIANFCTLPVTVVGNPSTMRT